MIQVRWLILAFFMIWTNMLSIQQGNQWPSMVTLPIHYVSTSRSLAEVQELHCKMELYNKAMSAVRMSVEWLLGDIVNYFKFLDFKKNLKISLSAVGKMYIVCAILRNALTCMYGNPT